MLDWRELVLFGQVLFAECLVIRHRGGYRCWTQVEEFLDRWNRPRLGDIGIAPLSIDRPAIRSRSSPGTNGRDKVKPAN
jgi:hypothetical protein